MIRDDSTDMEPEPVGTLATRGAGLDFLITGGVLAPLWYDERRPASNGGYWVQLPI